MPGSSAFEPYTEAIRKDRIARPSEFSQLVTIQDSEHQIIAVYEVDSTRPAGMTYWTPARLDMSRSSAAPRIWPPAIATLLP
jgi:hypothetical protein